MHACPQCGAVFENDSDSCESRFHALLALDHSRREPWGSRHGSAFAVFTLQHPLGRSREMLERCWTLLHRIVVAGDDPHAIARTLRRINDGAPNYLTVRRFHQTSPSRSAFQSRSLTWAILMRIAIRDF